MHGTRISTRAKRGEFKPISKSHIYTDSVVTKCPTRESAHFTEAINKHAEDNA